MDFKAEYQKKLVTAEEAVKVVKNGDWVDYGWCVNAPYDLDKALAARANELKDVKIRNGVTMWMPAIAQVENAKDHFTWNSWHCSGVDRKVISAGIGYFAPMRYAELPTFYRNGNAKVDVAMIQVTPMDNFGNFSYALSASHIQEVLNSAKTIIVEVNKNQPWVFGLTGSEINIKDVDYVVESGNQPLACLPAGGEASEIDNKIADMIVEQIPNGACLQLGIGNMPNAIGKKIAQSDLRDLGVHTEMYVDGFAEIAKAGKITGRNKALDKGRQVYAFAAGSQAMYDYMACNPDVMAAPVDYTNDPYVIAQLDNFISINNALEVDLFGQVSAESSGTKHISGTGGQLDFMLGAYLSKGGKSFICLTSTFKAKDGTLQSRIKPTFAAGTITTDPRHCTQYICTEYGIVNLKGLSTWERAEALISIADPQFQDQLVAEAEKFGIWRKSNK